MGKELLRYCIGIEENVDRWESALYSYMVGLKLFFPRLDAFTNKLWKPSSLEIFPKKIAFSFKKKELGKRIWREF